MHFTFFLLLLFLLIIITRPLTVIFHELGHAIPAMLLTREKVIIYIGSHGDPKKSIRFNIGILEVYFRYNPFAWNLGLCIPTAEEVSINRRILYTLSGPITSLLIALIAFYFVFSYDLHGFLKLLIVVFLGSSFFDLLINIFPSKTPIKLYDGTITYNDGHILKQLFYYKSLPKEYMAAIKLYNAGSFFEAGVQGDKLLSSGIEDENIYRLAIGSYLKSKDYERAKNLSEAFVALNKITSEDLTNMALAYSHLGLHEKAIEIYDKSLLQRS